MKIRLNKTGPSGIKQHILLVIVACSIVSATALAQNQQSRRGSGQRPQIDEATRAAVQACATKNNMPAPGERPAEGSTRPTREQHESFRACLSEAGIEMPDRGHGGPGGRGGGHSGGQRPPPPPDGEQPPEDNESE